MGIQDMDGIDDVSACACEEAFSDDLHESDFGRLSQTAGHKRLRLLVVCASMVTCNAIESLHNMYKSDSDRSVCAEDTYVMNPIDVYQRAVKCHMEEGWAGYFYAVKEEGWKELINNDIGCMLLGKSILRKHYVVCPPLLKNCGLLLEAYDEPKYYVILQRFFKRARIRLGFSDNLAGYCMKMIRPESWDVKEACSGESPGQLYAGCGSCNSCSSCRRYTNSQAKCTFVNPKKRVSGNRSWRACLNGKKDGVSREPNAYLGRRLEAA